jgi:hypothetical protein
MARTTAGTRRRGADHSICTTARTRMPRPEVEQIGGSRSCWRSRYVTASPPLSSGGHGLSAWRCGRQAELLWCGAGLPGGARDIRGHDVGGVPVQAAAGPVVADRGPRIGVRCGFLDVAQRHPCVECGGDERVPQRVRRDGFADPGAAGGLADDPPGAVPVQPPAVRSQGTPARLSVPRWPDRSPGPCAARAGWSRPCRPYG